MLWNSKLAAVAVTALMVIPVAATRAQQMPRDLPTKEDLAQDNNLFLTLARKALKWDEPVEPIRMVGPLYFVGTKGLSSFLFTTADGHILLNTAMPQTGDLIIESIRKAGFRAEDIKIIINGHAHSDHAGAFAQIKDLSGAQLAVMEADVAQMEDGGKSDFHYGRDWQIMGFPPVKVDRILREGDTVTLGDVSLTAYNTPGHTRGSTTWVTQLHDEGRIYTVVFPDGAGFNPGYKMTGSPSYPGIERDYRDTHHRLELLKPDIWAGHHTEYFDLEGKRKRAETEGVAAWVDPDGYRRFVAGKKSAFETLLNEEMDVAVSPSK
ncbi:MAG: subclass B3 metallo-beta-lactamase [Alphaproteobacteria bacterium]|nr:subclass B3 metallo-beta-lactamase [Alphaproteobacteria bacterium]MBU1548283.1 subclass B3 metallo-beta-lactamase [Alphaproteobacteria bacterium]MBU2335955.1 subclass B3 metallo-beta-lactamase [Alphaproteobacteria bacterium]MBU2390650.1 subclass B3 metallo-beta-lactamase [Alphaproteobacteria bacterium]